MGDPALAPDEHFTYRHYKTWPDEERWELIDGQAWSMSPAPRSAHQEIAARIFTEVRHLLKGKTCRAFIAPFDVLLPRSDEADDDVDTVVQPDIVVFCDRSKINEYGARGAPDLAVEVLSPSTSKKDLANKWELYQRHGVREYWVVDPGNRFVQVWRLGPDRRFAEAGLSDLVRSPEVLSSSVVEGLEVDPKELFAELD